MNPKRQETRQDIDTTIHIERRAVTAKECSRQIVSNAGFLVSGLLGVFLAQPLSLRLFLAVFLLFGIGDTGTWLGRLRRVRRGESVIVEKRITPRSQKAERVASLMHTAGATFLALFFTLFAVDAFTWVDFPLIFKIVPLTVSIAVWVCTLFIWKKMLQEGKATRQHMTLVAPATVDTTNEAAAVTAPASASRAGHWWTDTPLREEAKVGVHR